MFDSRPFVERARTAVVEKSRRDVTAQPASAGAPGAAGEDGAEGDPGPPGPAGVNGTTGAQGPIGPAGLSGDDGIDGEFGPQGPAGPQGTTGAQGPAGAAIYLSAESGEDGDPGPPGPTGAAGAQGLAGSPGADGADGEDGLTLIGSVPHAPTHQAGGADSIALDTLAATSDNTALNASTSAHGLLPKLSGGATDFLSGTGQWVTQPPAAAPDDARETDDVRAYELMELT